MNRVKMLISSLFLIMILSCWGCGKKGPPILPNGHSSVRVSDQGGEKYPAQPS
jgi:predicted small lipoprotein YifL